VVRTEEPVPSIDDPPELPYGVLLLMHELSLGVFAPDVRPDLGGSFTHIRQYQIRDRPSNLISPPGSGQEEALERANVQVRAGEIRVEVPNMGPHNDEITQWGLRFTCVLRHPVDAVYFPATRIPPEEHNRLPLGEPIS
jgi:hypothetical protein